MNIYPILGEAQQYGETMIGLPEDLKPAIVLDWVVFVETLIKENTLTTLPEAWGLFNTTILQPVYSLSQTAPDPTNIV